MFKDRADAGAQLAQRLAPYGKQDAVGAHYEHLAQIEDAGVIHLMR